VKFPRNARMFKGQLDAAPFACVLFCLLILLLVALLVPIPGIPIHLSDALPGQAGIEGNTVTVALDVGGPQNPHGVLYYQEQIIGEQELQRRLAQYVAQQVNKYHQPPTLILQMDKAVTVEQMDRLTRLAEQAGITNFFKQNLPGVFDSNAGMKGP
jgi:biopolymer transport protein ExbD